MRLTGDSTWRSSTNEGYIADHVRCHIRDNLDLFPNLDFFRHAVFDESALDVVLNHFTDVVAQTIFIAAAVVLVIVVVKYIEDNMKLLVNPTGGPAFLNFISDSVLSLLFEEVKQALEHI